MAALTPVDVANMALALLTEASIESLEDDDRNARLLNLHYDTTREAELLKRIWVFAILSAEIEGTEGDDGRYAFELPPDCLRPLPPTLWDVPGNPSDHWELEGSTLYLPWGGTRRIRYVGNLVDPTDWDALFTEVVAAALAIKIAHAVTGKASMLQVAQAAYVRALAEASRVNAILKQGRMPSGSWAHARGDFRDRGGLWRGDMRAGHGWGWWR